MISVRLKLHSFSNWNDKIAGLVELLDVKEEFRPYKWGPYEPERYLFAREDVAKIEECWRSNLGFGLKASRPKASMMLIRQTRSTQTNWLGMHLSVSYFNSRAATQRFLTFATELFAWGNIAHGYACHDAEFEQTNKLTRPTRINNKPIMTGGMDLQDCLPGAYWANFFGEDYVNWLGRDRFRTLPAYEQRELPNNGILVLTAHSPLAYAEGEFYKSAMRRHLGEDAFFDIRNPTRTCRSPYKDGTLRLPSAE